MTEHSMREFPSLHHVPGSAGDFPHEALGFVYAQGLLYNISESYYSCGL